MTNEKCEYYMNQIYKDKDLVDFLQSNNSLHDAKLLKINIYTSVYDVLNIELDFKMRESSNLKKLRLKFTGVSSYSFYYDDNYIFYNVEIFKFISLKDGVYLSLDPVDEGDMPSDDDQDFIFAKNVECFELK